MSATEETLLVCGIPHFEWIGRRMKNNQDYGKVGTKSRNPVRIVSFDMKNEKATVVPAGHKRQEVVPIEGLLPWWSENGDLRAKYSIVEKDEPEEPLIEKWCKLPIADWFGRWIKVAIAGKPTCNARLTGVSGDKLVVVTQERGKNTEHVVLPMFVSPNWGENQDLLEKNILLKNHEEKVGKVTMEEAFAKTEQPPMIAEEVRTEGSKKNEEERKSLETAFVERAAPILPQNAHRKVRNLIIGVDADESWMDAYRAFQEARKDKEVQHAQIRESLDRLKELDGLEHLCVEEMSSKGVRIEFDEPDDIPIATREQRPVRIGDPPVPEPKRKWTPRVPTNVPSGSDFVALIKQRLSPDAHYTIEDLMRALDIQDRKTVYNRVYTATSQGDLIPETPPGTTRKHYRLK